MSRLARTCNRTTASTIFRRFAFITIASVVAGCSTLPTDVERPESYALADTSDTLLARLTDPAESEHRGLSGFHLLPEGLRALESRLAMIDLAERSVDIQTYVWSADLAGGLITNRLWKAAERGVRVRVLIDDFLLDDNDTALAAFDSHPNIEVRIFNPFGARIEPVPILKIRRGIELITSLQRLNHRMHNKSFVVDDQMAVIGGRNIGDEYYDLGREFNFVDFDLLVIGPQVDEVSDGFDEFWNSEWAYPITAFRSHPDPAQTQRLLAALRSRIDGPREVIGIPSDTDIERASLERFIDRLEWARAELVFDDPDKGRGRNPDVGTEVAVRLRELAAETESELIIISPYFVPGPIDGTLVEQLIERGVRVRIVTNSLASTNHAAVHSGYKRYRKAVADAGIEMHETQAWLPELVGNDRVPWNTGKSGLHTKVLVFDREDIFVGTFNLDPRSIELNTEMGLVVNDSRIGAQVGEMADILFQPKTSWRVERGDDGSLVWRGEENGHTITYAAEPHASFGRKVIVFFASLLPIEDQL